MREIGFEVAIREVGAMLINVGWEPADLPVATSM